MSSDTAPQGTNPFAGILPGTNTSYFLDRGQGEKSVVFDTLFTILLTGDETDDQFDVFTTEGDAGRIIPAHLHLWTNEIFFVIEGAVHVWMDDEKGNASDRVLTAGGFGYIPHNVVHAFRIEATARILGASTANFGRFFHDMGRPTDKPGIPAPHEIYVPSPEQMRAAGDKYGTVFRPDVTFVDD